MYLTVRSVPACDSTIKCELLVSLSILFLHIFVNTIEFDHSNQVFV